MLLNEDPNLILIREIKLINKSTQRLKRQKYLSVFKHCSLKFSYITRDETRKCSFKIISNACNLTLT